MNESPGDLPPILRRCPRLPKVDPFAQHIEPEWGTQGECQRRQEQSANGGPCAALRCARPLGQRAVPSESEWKRRRGCTSRWGGVCALRQRLEHENRINIEKKRHNRGKEE